MAENDCHSNPERNCYRDDCWLKEKCCVPSPSSTPAIPADVAEAVSAAKTSIGTNDTFHHDWDTTCHISKRHLNTLITAATSSQSLRDENEKLQKMANAHRAGNMAEVDAHKLTIADHRVETQKIRDENTAFREALVDVQQKLNDCYKSKIAVPYGLIEKIIDKALSTYRGKEASDG